MDASEHTAKMARRAIVPATVVSSMANESTPMVQDGYPAAGSSRHGYRSSYASQKSQSSVKSPAHGKSRQRRASAGSDGSVRDNFYGSVAVTESPKTFSARWKSGPPIVIDDLPNEDLRYADDEEELEPEVMDDFTEEDWRYMSRIYPLVPLISLIFFALLVVLDIFAWPPNDEERQAGQRYPHPFLWQPALIGLFASVTVQVLRVPVHVCVAWFDLTPTLTTILTVFTTTSLHELLRLSTLPLIIPSITSGFHSSFYLGLGWGVAETTWGIMRGWQMLALYEPDATSTNEAGMVGKIGLGLQGDLPGELEAGFENESAMIRREEQLEQLEEAEIEDKVLALERARERRDLEELIGQPFPAISFPFHLLWRLDTLLFNLGVTLILSAFFFNSGPIIEPGLWSTGLPTTPPPANHVAHRASRFLWLAWILVVLLHVCVSLTWKFVGRLGVGAVTWAGLIISLGSVFAGLGAWGGVE